MTRTKNNKRPGRATFLPSVANQREHPQRTFRPEVVGSIATRLTEGVPSDVSLHATACPRLSRCWLLINPVRRGVSGFASQAEPQELTSRRFQPKVTAIHHDQRTPTSFLPVPEQVLRTYGPYLWFCSDSRPRTGLTRSQGIRQTRVMKCGDHEGRSGSRRCGLRMASHTSFASASTQARLPRSESLGCTRKKRCPDIVTAKQTRRFLLRACAQRRKGRRSSLFRTRSTSRSPRSGSTVSGRGQTSRHV